MPRYSATMTLRPGMPTAGAAAKQALVVPEDLLQSVLFRGQQVHSVTGAQEHMARKTGDVVVTSVMIVVVSESQVRSLASSFAPN